VKGRIISVNIAKDKGEKKHNVEQCVLIKGYGLENDAHGGFMHRQVSLLAAESIQKIRDMGLDVAPGDFAENLTIEGIDLPSLPVGTELRIAGSVLLRVTQIGKECHTRCNIYYQVGDCVMPREGIFAEVVEEGEVKVGDRIEVLT
jgi:MOSC domain-containing protein YiiM